MSVEFPKTCKHDPNISHFLSEIIKYNKFIGNIGAYNAKCNIWNAVGITGSSRLIANSISKLNIFFFMTYKIINLNEVLESVKNVLAEVKVAFLNTYINSSAHFFPNLTEVHVVLLFREQFLTGIFELNVDFIRNFMIFYD